jgi:hypothetical protein
MYLSPATRRHGYLLSRTFVRLALVAVFAAAIWNSGVLGVEKRVVIAARWVADHTGATRASEIWRASGRPAVDRAATTGYQFVRQAAVGILDYLDVSTPANSAAEKLRKVADGADPKPQGTQDQQESKATRNRSATKGE